MTLEVETEKNSVQQHAGKVDVSIIVPAYNEEQSLPLLIKGLIKMLRENSIFGEIIIANDGSIDNTGKIAGDLSNKYEVVLIGLNLFLGLGWG